MANIMNDIQKMASLVGGKSNMFELIATVLRSPIKRVKLRDDEDYQANVKFIKDQIGEDVEITKDMPPLHERCALAIGDNKLLTKMDAEMKLAMIEAVKEVKKVQKANGGYISWRRLQQIFDGNEMYYPVVEDDEENYESIVKNRVYLKFDGAPSMECMEEAEKLMRKTVNDQHIWESLKINKQTIKTAFGSEGVEVGCLKDIFIRSSKCAHIAIDVGVVRFPRPEDPFFKLYRLRVIVFKSETALAFINQKGSGIYVDFRQRSYKMSSDWNAQFTAERKEKVAAKFDDAFASLLGDL